MRTCDIFLHTFTHYNAPDNIKINTDVHFSYNHIFDMNKQN